MGKFGLFAPSSLCTVRRFSWEFGRETESPRPERWKAPALSSPRPRTSYSPSDSPLESALLGILPVKSGLLVRPAARRFGTLAGLAILRHIASRREHLLSSRTLIGRAPGCHLRVDDPGISGFHVEILWDGERWHVHDLGSRNGTVLGNRRLRTGEQAPLERDVDLLLAGRVGLRLIDDSAPQLIATSAAGNVRTAEAELLILPSEESPELTIFRDLDGQWLVESESGIRTLDEDAHLIAGNERWRVLSPHIVPTTHELDGEPHLRDHRLCFRVSRDGEHIELSMIGAGRSLHLEHRAHLALLLELARARLRDAKLEHVQADEQGWVYRDELPGLLGVQPELIHLWIHRARRQAAQAGLRDAVALIERRSGSTQLRLGTGRVSIAD